MMSYAVTVASLVLIVLVLVDAFEAMLLPRRLTNQYRFARLFYVYSWTPFGGPGPANASGEAPRRYPQLLRSALDPGADEHVGGRVDPGLRPAAMVARLVAPYSGLSLPRFRSIFI